MENSYGIGVRNRYALFLDDESDPLEILKEKEQEKEQKKKIKVGEKENKAKPDPSLKPKQAPLQKKLVKETLAAGQNKIQEAKREDNKSSQRTNDGKVERNTSKFNNENREERNNRRNREDRQFNGSSEITRDREERPKRDHLAGGDNFENRVRGGRTSGNREGGNKSGGLKGRTADNNRRGKREFDRQSGSDKTGVKPVEKRDGGGAHNWGSHKDIIEEVDKSIEMDSTWGEIDKNDSATSATIDVKEAATEPEAEPVAAPEAEEPKELTLDEWRAQRSSRIKPQYNIRKAGEGEDPSQWKKMYELKKKDEEGGGSDEDEFDALEYPQRVGRQKHVLDIDIHFSDARRANVGSSGRGRGSKSGRGVRPRGDRRFRVNEDQVVVNTQDESSQRNEKAPKVDDERDFPSLG